MNLEQFSLLLVGIIILIIVYSFIGNFLEHKNLHLLHETGVGIIIGLSFGFILKFAAGVDELAFDQQIFFYGLLPPMIFAGGYNLKKKDFGKNFIYILTYGLIGTVLVFALVFGLTLAVSELNWIVAFREKHHPITTLQTGLIVKYSATISATDSVAALTLIKSSQYPQLFSIIFGQGMVNDAVAIILFKVVGGLFDQINGDMSAGQIIKTILGSFLGTIVISVAIGLFSGVLCSYIFKKCRFLVESEVTQVAFTYIFGILSYVTAQFFDMSGVITVLISGVTLAHYNYYNLTVGGMHATTITFQSISFIAQAVVFVYLGISTVYYFINEVISFTFLALQLGICIFSRLFAVFGLSFIFKKFSKKWVISNQDLSVVSVAGMIRGSVAFALILTIQSNPENQDQVSMIKSTTLALVCLTTIVLGALMPCFIKLFLGNKNNNHNKPIKNQINKQTKAENQQKLLDSNGGVIVFEQKKQKKKGFFKYSDQHYWRPMLIHDYEQRKSKFKLYKRIMKYNNRQKYEGGHFYLLDLVEVDIETLTKFVDNIQRQQKELQAYNERERSQGGFSSNNLHD